MSEGGYVDSVIRTLKSAGFFNIRVAHMSRIPDASGAGGGEQCFSVGEKMTSEVSLELVCEDRRFEEAVTIIFDNGQSCDPEPGGFTLVRSIWRFAFGENQLWRAFKLGE